MRRFCWALLSLLVAACGALGEWRIEQSAQQRCNAFRSACTQTNDEFDYVFTYRAADLGEGRYRISGTAQEKPGNRYGYVADFNVVFFLIKDDVITGTVRTPASTDSGRDIRFDEEFTAPEKPDHILVAGYRGRVE